MDVYTSFNLKKLSLYTSNREVVHQKTWKSVKLLSLVRYSLVGQFFTLHLDYSQTSSKNLPLDHVLHCQHFNFFLLPFQEFETWKASLTESEQKAATGFFSVIKRHDDSDLDWSVSIKASDAIKHSVSTKPSKSHDLFVVPYSLEYSEFLTKAAELLQRAAQRTDSSR